MKKVLAMILCVVMVAAIALAGCGGGGGSSNSDSTGSGGGAGGAGDVATVLATTLGDKSFNDSCWAGLNTLKDKYGIEIAYYELKADYAKTLPALTEYAESGDWEIIVSGSYSTVEGAQAAVEAFPNQKFIHYDASVQDTENGPYANAFSMEYKQNEGSYLVGWLAGKLTSSGTIAALGAQEADVIWDFIYGYLEGAKAAREDIKVITSFVGDWENVSKAKDLANDAMSQGADILFHIAGGAGAGMFEAIAESGKTGVWGIGVDSDQYAEYEAADKPEIANIVLTSMIKNVGNSLVWAYEREVAGTLEWGTHVVLGIAEDTVGPAESGGFLNLDQAILDEYKQIKQDVADGKIKVSTAFGQSSEEQAAFADSFRP